MSNLWDLCAIRPKTDIVLAGIALVAMLGFALDTALRNLERHASRWEEHHG